MNSDDALKTLQQKFDETFPFFIKKDYCEPDWVEFYEYLKKMDIMTVCHDGGFYFHNKDEYLMAIMVS